MGKKADQKLLFSKFSAAINFDRFFPRSEKSNRNNYNEMLDKLFREIAARRPLKEQFWAR